MNPMTNSAGVLAPTAATMPARAAARLYAGATDEAAMTMLPVRPRTPERSPFPPTVAAAAGTVEAVRFMAPHCAEGVTERPIGHPSEELDSQRRSRRRLFLRSTRRLCLKPGTDVKVRREQARTARGSRTRGRADTQNCRCA